VSATMFFIMRNSIFIVPSSSEMNIFFYGAHFSIKKMAFIVSSVFLTLVLDVIYSQYNNSLLLFFHMRYSIFIVS